LHDLEPGFGPLGGIERALNTCRTPLLLVVAVDLPRMTTAFLAKLAARADTLTGVLPLREGEPEPLAAIYPKRCHEIARRFIARSRHSVCDFAEACRREGALRTFQVARADAVCFANWNSPVDVALDRRQLGPHPRGVPERAAVCNQQT
jgi:molybdopterin-guanine dinucleotide biosynthesis protein A